MTNDIKEKTFFLLKPDAVQRNLVGRIISRFEDKGFKLVAGKMVMVSRQQAEKQYECHLGKSFYPSLIEFITSSPSFAVVMEGKNAIKIGRRLMGATDPLEAEPGTIRGDFSIDVKHNLIHGSDSEQSYEHEMKIYFSKDEIQNYQLALEPWIYYK
ncbi:MAG: nucleoside-diphosphate kinase [Candidatus Rifleibacteriota bacterium]